MSRSTWVRLVAALAFMVTLASPLTPPAAAQDDTCEAGQSLDAETGECIDPVTDDGTSDEASDDGTTDDSIDDSTADDASDDQTTDDTTDPDMSDEADATTDDMPADDGIDDDMTDDAGTDEPTTVTDVVLHTFACPEGWDVDEAGLDASYFPCQTQHDQPVSYTVSGPGGISLSLEGIGDLDAATAFGPELPPGTWTIAQSTTGTAWANCLIFDAEGVQYDNVTGPVAGRSLSFDLVAGDWLECEWFTNAGGAGAMAKGEPLLALNVQSYNCPYGYALEQGRETLAAGCTLKAAIETATFVATVDGVEVARGSAPADDYFVESMTPYDSGYLSGAWRIEQILPEGYTAGIVYCQAGSGTGGPRETADSGTIGAVSITVLPGEELRCVGYAIEEEPRDGAARGLTIVGHLCPAGSLRADATLATCTLSFDGNPAYVDVDLYGGADTVALIAQTGLTPITKQYTFAGVTTAGTWRLDIKVPGERARAEMECLGELSNGQAQVVRTSTPPLAMPGITVTVGVDHHVTCHLLLFQDIPADNDTTTIPDDAADPAGEDDEPASDTSSTDAGSASDSGASGETTDPADANAPVSTVTLTYWNCPATMSPSASLEDLLFTCTASDEQREVLAGPDDLVSASAASVAWCAMNHTDDSQDTFPEAYLPDTAGNLPLDLSTPAIIYCDLFEFGAI